MAEVSSLFVRIGADTRGLTQALSVASRQIASFGATSKTAATTSSAAFRGAQVAAVAFGALAVKGLTDAVHAAEDWATEVRTLQKTTGLAAEQASALVFVGDSLGVSVDKLSLGFGLLDKNIVNGTTNFEKYGVATTDAMGNQLDFTTILGNLADKYEELGGGIKGAAFAQNVFGRSGRNLIPILARGSEGIAELMAQAQDYGLVIGQDVVDNAREAAIAQRQLGLSIQGLKVQIGANLIPIFDLAVKALTSFVLVLHSIPGPVIDLIGLFAILTGALVALQFAGSIIARAWAPIIGAFTGAGAAATEQAAGTALATGGTEALTAAVSGLIGPLQALAGVEAEVAAGATAAGEALGFQATASGLLVPETVALEASGAAAAATAPGIAGIGVATGAATVGVIALGAALVGMKVSMDAAHRSFEAGVQRDLAALSGGSTKAAGRVRALAAEAKRLAMIASGQGQPGDITAIGAAFAVKGNVAAYNQATEATKRYDEQQQLLASNSTKLTTSLAATVRQMDDISDSSSLSAEQVGLLDSAIVHVGAGIGRLGPQLSGSVGKIVTDFRELATSGKASFPEVQAAALAMVQQTKAAFADWHDSIVSNFGGAGAALDDFANKTNVDIGRATAHLRQYQAQIQRYGDDLKTIEDEFGKRASGFIEWATSQGLAQAGLVGAVADANKKNAQSFVSSFNQAQSATSSLASQIQKALDPVFQSVLLRLKNIARALRGLPPIKAKDDTTPALKDIQGRLRDLALEPHLVQLGLDPDEFNAKMGEVNRKLLGVTKHDWNVLVAITGGASATLTAIQNGLNNLPAERAVDVYIRTHRVNHEGGYVFHGGGVVPASREVAAHAARMHEGGAPGRALRSDEVPAILQRGEFVIRRSAVSKIGVPALEALNSLHVGGLAMLHDGGKAVPISEREMPVQTPRVGSGRGAEDQRVRLSVDRRRFGRDLEYDALTDGY